MSEAVTVGTGQGGLGSTSYPIHIPGVTAHEVTVRHGFVGGLRVYVDGERAKRGPKRNEYLVPADDGREVGVAVGAGTWGATPTVEVGTEAIRLGRQVEGAEWIWVGLPLLLVVSAFFNRGGAAGILVGGLAFVANLRIFVNDGLTTSARYLTSLAAIAIFIGIYVAAAVTIGLLFL